jgi:hypothetical protein
MQFTAEITAIRSFHNFQRVMDFFQLIFLSCSYLLEDSKWILFTVITVLTAAHLQCIRLMLTRYQADAGNVYHCSNAIHPPLVLSQFYFLNPEGREQSQVTRVFFFVAFFSNAMGFFSMVVIVPELSYSCIYMVLLQV